MENKTVLFSNNIYMDLCLNLIVIYTFVLLHIN